MRSMQEFRGRSVRLSFRLSVCLLVTFVSPAKTAELIEIPFGGLTLVGPRKHVLDRVKVGRIHLPPQGVTRPRVY